MMDEFLSLLKKKKESQGSVNEKKLSAKKNAMKELSDMLGEDITEGIKGVKKVTVASDSEEGLKKGLEKAEDVLESRESEEEDMDSEMMEDESEDDLASKIASLEQQLKELKSKR